MTSRFAKTAIGLLLGFVVAWQGVFSIPDSVVGAIAVGAKSKCCRSGCDSRHCSTPACCAKPADHRVPFAPASPPSVPKNELAALAPSLASVAAPLSLAANQRPSRNALSASVTAIPLFQRDCCYLI